MPNPRNIAHQLDTWQRARRLSDAEAAHRLDISLVLFTIWKAGTACPYAALLETKMGVPVKRVNKSAGGIILGNG